MKYYLIKNSVTAEERYDFIKSCSAQLHDLSGYKLDLNWQLINLNNSFETDTIFTMLITKPLKKAIASLEDILKQPMNEYNIPNRFRLQILPTTSFVILKAYFW